MSLLIRAIGIALLLYLLWQVDLREVLETLSSVRPLYFLLSLCLLALSSFFGMLKWATLVRAQKALVSLRSLAGYYGIGMFLGVVTPGKIGEFWRARYIVRKSGLGMTKALGTVFIDRGVDLIITSIVGASALAFLFLFSGGAFWWSLLSLFLVSIFWYLFRNFWDTSLLRKLISFTKKSFLFLLRRHEALSTDSNADIKDLLQYAFDPKIWLYGVLYYILTVGAYFALAISLSLDVPFFYLFLITALVSLILILPVTVLGLGTRDTSYIFLLGIIHIAAPEAIAFSTLILISGMIVSIPGGILLLKNSK